MNYPLLLTMGGLLASLFGMERWCSWRLGASRRPRLAGQALPQAHPAAAPESGDTQAQVPAGPGLPVQS